MNSATRTDSDRGERPDTADVAGVDPSPPVRGHVPLLWAAVAFAPWAAFVWLSGLAASPDNAGIAYQTMAAAVLVLAFTAVVVLCVVFNRRYVGTPLLGWPGWQRLLLETIIAIPIAIGWGLLLSFVAQRLISPQLLRGLAGANIYSPVVIAPAVYCLAGFTIGPLAEEMLYRGVLYRSLRRWMAPVFAAVLQAIVFGVMHHWDVVYMSMAFVTGLLLIALYLWRETLWSPLLVHGLINAMGMIPLLVALVVSSHQMILGIEGGGPGPSAHSDTRLVAVFPGTPADQAHVKVGDVITAVNQQPIHHFSEVTQIVKAHKPGDIIDLTIKRAGRTMQIPIKLRVLRPHILW